MVKKDAVPRPLRKSEYQLQFATRNAEIGWRDLVATNRNSAADAWDFLTISPTNSGVNCYRLKDSLAKVTIDGEIYDRWQYKATAGGRIWYAIIPPVAKAKIRGFVLLERVSTAHPNETVKQHR